MKNKYMQLAYIPNGISFIIRWIMNIKYYFFKKKFRHATPSFEDLWEFAEFIKIVERVFLYENINSAIIFSSKKYEFGENGFIITNDKYKLKVKLISDSELIFMDMETKYQIKTFRLGKGQWLMDHDELDDLILDECINTIIDGIFYMIDYVRGSKHKSFHYE